jgi:hypothetical protein
MLKWKPLDAELPKATLSLPCGTPYPLTDRPPLTYVTDCGEDDIYPDDSTPDATACNNICTGCVITRTWKKTECEKTITRTQVITIEKFKPDTFKWTTSPLPADDSLGCGATLPTGQKLSYASNCGTGGNVDYEDSPPCTNKCDGCVRTRTWKKTICNTDFTQTQSFAIAAAGLPVLATPGDVKVGPCEVIPDKGTLTWSDDCGGLGTAMNPADVDDDKCANSAIEGFTSIEPGTSNRRCSACTFKRRYTASECGSDTKDQSIILAADETNPTFDASNKDITCGERYPSATAGDTCVGLLEGFPKTVANDDEVLGQNCAKDDILKTVTRHWEARDKCGNTATDDQVLTVKDPSPPHFDTSTCPESATLSCSANIAFPQAPTAQDDCGNPSTVFKCCVDSGAITRTWTAKDACGKTATCEQVVTIGGNDCD